MPPSYVRVGVTMLRAGFAVLLVGLALGSAGDAAARPDQPAADVGAIRRDETEARAKAAAEMVSLLKFCEQKFAFDDARQACAKAIEFCPDDAALKAEAVRLEKKKGTVRPASVTQIADRRAKNLAKCTELIAPVALAYAQVQRGDDLNRLISLLRIVGAPPPTLDIAFFEPYLDWHSKKDVELLQAGSEYFEGAWLDPAKVAELNAAHTDWANPWIVSDDAFEVRTTEPLRTARQVLARAAAQRRVFLRYFAGEWDLRQPAAKLRIFVTGTRADLDARQRAECPNAPPAPPDASAYYVDSPQPGSPCFVCFEAPDAKAKATKLDFTGIRWALQHEVAHQVAFEYSKHAKGLGRMIHAAVWAIEGVAEFAPYLDIVEGACIVTHPSWVPSRGRELDSAFGWCRTNVDKIPPIDEFFSMPRLKYLKGKDNDRIAATFVWFLLEANGRGRRKGFLKYLEAIHQDRDSSDSFSECMGGVGLPVLDNEFRAFARAIRTDEK